MIDYYKVFNLSLAKQNGTLTDEMVRKSYEAKKEQYLKMKSKENQKELNGDSINSVELSAYQDDDYLTFLEDGYCAIHSENARKHYDELMEKIQEHIDKQRKNKFTNINFEEMIKQTKTLDTKQLLEEIKLKASEKHPIPEPKEISSEREI